MAEYIAPIKDMQFVLKHVVGLDQVNTLPGHEEITEDVVDAILEEASKLAHEVLSPLNITGDKNPSKWKDGVVTTPPGFKDAYWQYVNSGWGNILSPAKYGGQELPHMIATPVEEMWGSANLAFKLCPMLTQGAIEAIAHVGPDALREKFLPNMISGKWTGTMNLTEPQAGSDLSLVRTKATPQSDGTFRLKGQKIFITYGEHDYTENIIHLVLARIDGAPEGVKGISLFVVPKFNVKPDGSLGDRNDVKCVSIEHKLGIHASPTAVMAYGEKDGATGYLVGEANRGLEYMFIMMNAARLSVGLEGVAIAERAYQRALAWSRERLQGKPVGVKGATTAPIVQHPDVKRMLLTMKSITEASRALAYWTSAILDRAREHPDEEERRRSQAMVDFLIPIVKGWSTENGIDVASLGIQVHGGMGFIEETGAAQHLRDARITTIYEGTTGIQANDLVGRKIGREEGRTALVVLAEVDKVAAQLSGEGDPTLKDIGMALATAAAKARETVQWISRNFATNAPAVAAGSTYVLKLLGITFGGWMLARSAQIATKQLAAGEGDASYLKGKVLTARFFADHILSQVPALAIAATKGGESVLAVEESFL
ncbi:3-methylmercaptopropionyl-CoA dehydrogenase [Usitatibacter rugosus]|uniref:3-methylmercaptopropionyl-CoA dehydrogenase n=1 Tax=Usitatibacter rugosus TaxID=2732067 RepID=A0A6M4GTY3_9PROT|nr:acyl-CoA dehydrogenase [Usitatibacter rugosus]QJR10809.1 3-methylmercaptopropionyl-CoA dehydrogenase [Usitatibacter rugosus]